MLTDSHDVPHVQQHGARSATHPPCGSPDHWPTPPRPTRPSQPAVSPRRKDFWGLALQPLPAGFMQGGRCGGTWDLPPGAAPTLPRPAAAAPKVPSALRQRKVSPLCGPERRAGPRLTSREAASETLGGCVSRRLLSLAGVAPACALSRSGDVLSSICRWIRTQVYTGLVPVQRGAERTPAFPSARAPHAPGVLGEHTRRNGASTRHTARSRLVGLRPRPSPLCRTHCALSPIWAAAWTVGLSGTHKVLSQRWDPGGTQGSVRAGRSSGGS